MANVRALVKLTLLFGGMLLIFGTYLALQFVLRPFRSARQRAHDVCVRSWAKYCAWALSMRVIVEGMPPEPPFFMVSNHLSYIDVIALLTRVRATFLAKSEIARWPLFGMLARGVGTLFIDRTRKRDLVRVAEAFQHELRQGRGIVVFPEATSWNGDEILRFKASTLEVAVQLGMPVYCAAIHYSTPPGSETARTSVCWWGDMRLRPHMLRLAALPGLTARIRFAAEPVRGNDRKVVAETAHHVVASIHRELRDAS